MGRYDGCEIIKSKRPKPKGPVNRDTNERINYLYQLSHLLATHRTPETTQILSRSYAATLASVANKSVTKLTPAIKRTICKKCNRILIPGISSELELENRSKEQKPTADVLIVRCQCSKVKRYPIGQNRAYKLFSEQAVEAGDSGSSGGSSS